MTTCVAATSATISVRSNLSPSRNRSASPSPKRCRREPRVFAASVRGRVAVRCAVVPGEAGWCADRGCAAGAVGCWGERGDLSTRGGRWFRGGDAADRHVWRLFGGRDVEAHRQHVQRERGCQSPQATAAEAEAPTVDARPNTAPSRHARLHMRLLRLLRRGTQPAPHAGRRARHRRGLRRLHHGDARVPIIEGSAACADLRRDLQALLPARRRAQIG